MPPESKNTRPPNTATNPAAAQLPAKFQLAIALHQQGQLAQAQVLYEEILKIQPGHFDALHLLGIIAYLRKNPQQALELIGKAIDINPDSAATYNNRGLALHELKQLDAAIADYGRAIELKSDNAEAYYNRGNALRELKQLDAAIASYDKAIAIKLDYAKAYSNRGVALQELGRLDAAIASFDRALEIRPDYAEAHYNRAAALQKLRRFPEAAQAYRHLLEIDPGYSFGKGDLLHAKMLCCDWGGLNELYLSIKSDIAAGKKSASPFGFQAISTSEKELLACAEIYANDKFPAQKAFSHPGKNSNSKKIRIGYLCGEFRQQATSLLMAELFELHDKDQFETIAFDNGWDDGSEIRKRIVKAFDMFIDISNLGDFRAAQTINENNIDILVNLNGYFGESRQGVFSYKPSSIQVNYLGFPGTLGAKYIDYLVADRVVIPQASRPCYSEKIVYLPNSYQANDSMRQISDKEFSREELGLPKDGFVFCCFNNNYKITPATFDGWMRILKQVEGSVLWLYQDNPTAANNLAKEARTRDVSPTRLIFAKRLPLAEHLARHRAADLFLDTLPYNAHTTASDALWAGLPVLTCIGSTFPGRVAASLLNAIGLPELVTQTPEDYEALAIELSMQPEKFEAIKAKLERNRLTTPLFDSKLFTRHIEAAYIKMHERCRAGLLPEHISID